MVMRKTGKPLLGDGGAKTHRERPSGFLCTNTQIAGRIIVMPPSLEGPMEHAAWISVEINGTPSGC